MKPIVSQEDIDNITKILNEEITITKRLRDIQTIKAFYGDELDELRATMHTTREGVIMFVSQMTDDHLLNTVRMAMEYHGNNLKSVPRKYLTEVKKRKLIDQLLSSQAVLEKPSNALEYTDDLV